jgi:hypothetical protein
MPRRQPDPFSYHEALDRSRVLADMVEALLVGHPAIKAHPRWLRRAERAANELRALHQNISTHTDGSGRT